jgi:hypothetical protein
MRHFKVTVAYVVYVEDDTDDNAEEIAIEHLDEFFAHERHVTTEEIRPDDVARTALAIGLREGGWAVDSEKTAATQEP